MHFLFIPCKKSIRFAHYYNLYRMEKSILFTDKAPAPIGPYSQGVAAAGMLYLSGQIALHPETGVLEIDNIDAETHRVMLNIKALLDAKALSFNNVIKSTIFLKNMDDFAKVNAVYGSYFQGDFPARETVQVSRLPKDVNVEISMIAAL
jgi:2-iminobutanoate/2-iminopropanoate deaminase